MRKEEQTAKQLRQEIIRFLLVGGLATICDYLVAYCTYRLFCPPVLLGENFSLLLSTLFGFCVGLLVNWILSLKFVFLQAKTTQRNKGKFLKFFILALVGLFLTEVGMLIVPYLPSFHLFSSPTFLGVEWKWWTMKVVMTAIVLVCNYLGRKFWVFTE